MAPPAPHPRPWRSLALAATAALLLAGCGPGVATAPPVSPDPAEPAYAAALRPELEALVDDMLVTGAVVQVRSPELGDWTTTFGTRTFRGTEPVQTGDHIRIGSVTKTWTGTVVLQLVEEGVLRLEDPVAAYRPDVPNGQAITIEQLLTMRSGLGNYTRSADLARRLDQNPGTVLAPEELIAIGLAMPAQFPPGEGFSYSNTNTALLGRIVEQVTGNSLEEEIQRRVLDRVGMPGSSFPTKTSVLPEPHPQGYTYGTFVETVDTNVLPSEKQEAARAGTLAPLDVTGTNPSWAWSAGAGISTSDDLIAYVRELVGGGLLSPEMQRVRLESVRPIDPADPESPGYGLALARFGPFYGHTGELPGFNTFAGHDPERDTTVVVWTSLAPSVDGRDPAAQMARTIIGELYGGGG
ncbi:MAG TPA: serine hydrolase domain-containing protein [Pseudonocardia sp.]|jgi:D-alanyl-D-alanine carboxypeptidase|uniref:serine hydrolase domain-containing protein n=1 Tax=Pseudonocardia sp. TaxID=60912 RepID=UPI002B4B48F8|nr:serine hydrolase domain-containing protein [Pseudonocardia sp.]HLU56544.1 serine hydrolase domain-containing protein [Pseudonocardia sp.]